MLTRFTLTTGWKRTHEGEKLAKILGDSKELKFESGLNYFLLEQYNLGIGRLLHQGWEALHPRGGEDLSFISSGHQPPTHSVDTILFAAAGSGKTQQVYDLFCNKYGHYISAADMVENSVEEEIDSSVQCTEDDTETLMRLKSRGGGASRDTMLLYKYSYPSEFYPALREPLSFAFSRLYENRLRTLEEFLGYPRATPAWWLLFQTVCSSTAGGYDPFFSTLNILLLTSEFSNNRTSKRDENINNTVCDSVTCIDNAQFSLERNQRDLSTLHHLIVRYRELTGIEDKSFMILSGTSLNLEKVARVATSAEIETGKSRRVAYYGTFEKRKSPYSCV